MPVIIWGRPEYWEGMDQQRIYDTYSTLYAGAALVAVIDSQVRGEGQGDCTSSCQIPLGSRPCFDFFSGFGGLSTLAALNEFKSLQLQLESSHGSIDPWLQMRRNVVGTQVLTFAAQTLIGAIYTFRAITGGLTVLRC